MAKLLLSSMLSYVLAKSAEQTVSNGKGLSFFWHTSTPNGIPTIHGSFKLTDPSTKFNQGSEIRIGLEIANEADKLKWRDQMIFYGPVADGKFTNAYIGKKAGQTGYLSYWANWTKNIKTNTYTIEKDSWASGITILDNESNKIDATAQTASFEFTRALKTIYLETMDISIGRDYLVYISHGVFPSQYSQNAYYVKGAIKTGTN